jgi:hypothetical protein
MCAKDCKIFAPKLLTSIGEITRLINALVGDMNKTFKATRHGKKQAGRNDAGIGRRITDLKSKLSGALDYTEQMINVSVFQDVIAVLEKEGREVEEKLTELAGLLEDKATDPATTGDRSDGLGGIMSDLIKVGQWYQEDCAICIRKLNTFMEKRNRAFALQERLLGALAAFAPAA